MLEPKVSIIVPLYNQERYIGSCLQSICCQTYKNIEIIVVNDGSSDNSLDIAYKWAENDNRIKVLDKKNEGTSFARRDGYLQATGDFLAFVDNDDLLPADAIRLLVQCAERCEADLVLGDVVKKLGFIEKKLHYGSFPVNTLVTTPKLFDDYYIGFFRNSVFLVNIWGRLYRKSRVDEAYKSTELFSTEMPCMAGDEYFNLKLFPYLKSMYRIDDVVYKYRYGGTVDHYNPYFPEVFILSEIRLNLLDMYDYSQGYEPLFKEYLSSLYGYAAMLIHYKKTDKNGVIQFFHQEIENRSVIRRMLEFDPKDNDKSIEKYQLYERNFDGMYEYSSILEKIMYGSKKYKLKRLIFWLVKHIS